MSFFLASKIALKRNHLLPTNVGTIMKNNHIIVGLEFSCAFQPTGFATLQRIEGRATPPRPLIGCWVPIGGLLSGYRNAFAGWRAWCTGRFPRRESASVDSKALHF